MSVNSSSDLLPHLAPPPSNLTLSTCFRSNAGVSVFSAASFTSILLLPLLLRVIYLGHQQWRRQRPLSAAGHADVFTFHSVAMQLNEYLGFAVFFCGGYIGLQPVRQVGVYAFTISSLGQGMFHLLTCVERYLAVVHPVTYLGLRRAGGARIRGVAIGGVWLLCSVCGATAFKLSAGFAVVLFSCVIVFFLAVLSVCSVLVLCALVRPMPGKEGGKREPVDQSKQRAFHIILAVMGVLALRFGGNLVCTVMLNVPVASELCVALMSTLWLSLPSNLLTSLLFLHRAGRPPSDSG